MTIPKTIPDKKSWLEDNIGPVTTRKMRGQSYYVSQFKETALFNDGSNVFRISGQGATQGTSLCKLFAEVTKLQHRFHHIQIGQEDIRRLKVDPVSLTVETLPDVKPQ